MIQAPDPITILLADDHPIFRTGLRQIIEQQPGFKVVAEAGDGRAALSQIEMLDPDLAVFDLSMPGLDGFGALEGLGAMGCRTRALIVSMHAESGYASRAHDLGAIGFIAKEDAPTEIIRALREWPNGFFMSQSVGGHSAAPATAAAPAASFDLSVVTPAERKILVLLSLGKTSKQIARDLDISHRTVQAHRRNIAEKLGVTGPNRLLEIAVSHRAQLLDPG
ncbi:MAG: response regulator transcription factor [Roseitalea sp.]|nr:response regulator transcription factor [Roseitalea sp.]MBO6720408.1 response regulator transcription factor [Roseitalea sp.]MBO6742768.1 response regulator transcription factor [Roseitalea sp.]